MYTDGLIHRDTTSTPMVGISINDIQQAVGRGVNDIGLLASDQEWYETGEVDQQGNPIMALRDAGRLDPYAKFKPLALVPTSQHPEYIGEIPDADRESNMYGLTIPYVTTAADLFDVAFAYEKPTQCFRVLDFGSSEYPNTRGYFNRAQPSMCCVTPHDSSVEYNAINENAQSVEFLFYVYSKYGSSSNNFLFDRICVANEAMEDKGDTHFGLSSTLRESIIAVEDLTVHTAPLATRSVIGNSDTYFGIALFKDGIKSGYKGSLFCNTPLGYRATAISDMCGLDKALPSSTYDVGDYVGIPFLSIGNALTQGTVYYYPLPKYPTFGGIHKINVKVGSISDYPVSVIGVSDSVSGTPAISLTTTSNTVYLFLDVKNNGLRDHISSQAGNLSHWTEQPRLVGHVQYQAGGSYTDYDNTILPSDPYPCQLQNSIIQIPAGGTTRLVFQISRIWSDSRSQAIQQVYGGYVDIYQHLFFDNDEFTATTPLIRVTYGNS